MELEKEVARNTLKCKDFVERFFYMYDVLDILTENSNNEEFKSEMELVFISNLVYLSENRVKFYQKENNILKEGTTVILEKCINARQNKKELQIKYNELLENVKVSENICNEYVQAFIHGFPDDFIKCCY